MPRNRYNVQAKMTVAKILVCLLVLVTPKICDAGQVDVMFGGLMINASTQLGSSTTSNLGVYRIQYSSALKNKFKFGLGFTVILGKIYTGDMGFGIDIGGSYYPWTENSTVVSSTENVQLERRELWRPYVGLSFNQRQFQVVQASSYAGFGGHFGIEHFISNSALVKTELRYIFLAGPSRSSASNLDLTAGVGFEF